MRATLLSRANRVDSRALLLVLCLYLSPALAERVVLVSVDGLKASYLTAVDQHGLAIPTLRGLIRAGLLADGVVPPVPSNTLPAHATMITGVWPAAHGITDNDQFAPGTEDNARIFHYYSDLKAPTLFDVARRSGQSVAAIGWPVTTGAPVDWLYPESPGGVPEIGKFMYAETSSNLRHVLGSPAGAAEDGDERRFELALAALGGKPDLMVLHVSETDEAQHEHGPDSPEALAAIEELDARLGRFIAEACTAGYLDDVTLIVTADHGFRPLHTGYFLMPLFRSLGLLGADEQGEVTDWIAYPWPAAGASPIYLNEAAEPEARVRVDQVLDFLETYLAEGIARIYRGEDLPSINGFPGAHAVISLRPGYAFGAGFENPIARSPTRTRGIHGYVPDAPDMHAALLAAGPRVEPGQRLGVLQMTDLAPSVAALLSLELPDAEGRIIPELSRGQHTPGGWSCGVPGGRRGTTETRSVPSQ